MIRSPINFSDWVPGEGAYANREPGAFTGFGTFSTDPSDGGVMDSRGAFNPAFNGQVRNPMFEAETDAYRSALPALARKARTGDANAVLAYNQFYGDLASRKKIYDLAYSTGLNDKNSTDIMNHVLSTVDPRTFGGGTDQFRTEKVRYLARQAQRRGRNAEDLFATEQMLDDSFRTSFMSSMTNATGITRAGGLKEVYGANDGMMANACLFLKKGLSEWESKNGLRDDRTRMAIIGRASEYYAKCLANPGLRPLAGDALSIIDAAAGDSGAVTGVRGRNKFDDYSRAVSGLDRGFISYTGNPDGDRAAGYGADGESDGRTAAFWAVRDAFERGYGANVAAGRLAREFDDNTRAQLVSDLKANLREVSPRAAAMKGYDSMIDSFATDIMNAGVEYKENRSYAGGVDLNKLSMKYFKDFKVPEATKVEQPLGFRSEFQDFATRMINWGIDERPYIKRKFGSQTMNSMGQPVLTLTNDLEAQYDPVQVKTHVRDEIDRMVLDPKFEAIRGNSKFLSSVVDMISGYVSNANSVADPNSAKGNMDEYRRGIVDRINLLYMGEELQRRGVILDGWSPNVVGEDYQVRGNTTDNLKGMYSQLSERIGRRLDELGTDTTGMHGVDLHNWHFLDKAKRGIDLLMKSGEDDQKAADYRKLFDAYAGSDLSAARRYADGAVALDRSKTIRSLAAPTQGLNDEAAALSVLAEDMFSDTLNPVEADRAKRFAAIHLNGADYRYLDAQTKKMMADQYHLGVLTLMKQVRRAHPELPVTAWSNDDFMFKQLGAVAAPLFGNAKEMSDMLGRAKQAELDQAAMRRVQSAVMTAEEKEKKGL